MILEAMFVDFIFGRLFVIISLAHLNFNYSLVLFYRAFFNRYQNLV